MGRRALQWVPGLAAIVVLLIAWQIAVAANDLSPLVLPSPSAIYDNVSTHLGAYWHDALVTLIEAVVGFFVAFVVSALLAAAMVRYRVVKQTVDPLAVLLRCLPVVALAPALALWLGFGLLPKVIVVALITFPPFLVNIYTGLRTVDVATLEVLESVNASKNEILWKLRVPNSLPFAFSAMKVCATLALIGAVVGEWSASSEGLGYRILRAQKDLETPTVWGAIAVLAVVGLVATLLIAAVEKRSLRWRQHENK